ncbi:Methyltransferase domain-containing protein [Chitinophaga jiangningensis]|uniref:Methyltransferase domain-containing protein n=1 Tax=Chitinophaga jiangningensis TaxID=1419482 RepID=A0A1M7B5K8_9BACT|nr:class I SAM-dependent methyltransferase [Chitinophaga jiangningensis]SHL50298.1 Methyltransferase domain-containing protein [Chitinophaga jiangningensis]
MTIREAYNDWASQYDTNENKTRDLEAFALRETLHPFTFKRVLEIGAGTGKNTSWLVEQADHITAVDFSEEMQAIARDKFAGNNNITFQQADITKPWDFVTEKYDIVTFSLVLEHIQDLDHIFAEVARSLNRGGLVYMGELHPFRQYGGSGAKFQTSEGEQRVQVYTHHISEFVQVAARHGLQVFDAKEYFDDGNTSSIPRILVLLLSKN